MNLRPHQIEGAEDANEAFASGAKSIVLCMATGGGKTHLGAHLVQQAVDQGQKVIWLAHRTELIDQAFDKLRECGMLPGVVMANDPRSNKNAPVQVASVQTLANRLKPSTDPRAYKWIPGADLIVVDECHHIKAGGTYAKILEAYPDAKIIGLTATPERTDGAGLEDMFERLIVISSPRELMLEGYLSPYEIYESPLKLDFSKSRKAMGEYNEKEVSIIIDRPKVVADVYQTWVKHAYGKSTLVFARNRAHGMHLQEEFKSNGVAAEYVDDKTKAKERKRIIARYLSRQTRVLINIGLFTEGTDLPLTECVQMTWPTLSLIRYLQIVGRGLRPSPETGKTICTILDHGGNVERHFLPDDHREWSLYGRKKRPQPKVAPLKTCPMCFAIFRPQARECPRCGHMVISMSDPIPEYADVELVKRELTPRQIAIKQAEAEAMNQRVFLDTVMRQHRERPRHFKWPLLQFKEKFGKYPGKKHGVKINWESLGSGYAIKGWTYDGSEVTGRVTPKSIPQPQFAELTDEEIFSV